MNNGENDALDRLAVFLTKILLIFTLILVLIFTGIVYYGSITRSFIWDLGKILEIFIYAWFCLIIIIFYSAIIINIYYIKGLDTRINATVESKRFEYNGIIGYKVKIKYNYNGKEYISKIHNYKRSMIINNDSVFIINSKHPDFVYYEEDEFTVSKEIQRNIIVIVGFTLLLIGFFVRSYYIINR